ncbi:hypothetical protein ASPWEDRAFT_188323 [Aspergillus wentii DTO 134E9]|uniref:Uncharacterized protein n=1 Tax=Aspergillus wentii DTO 134E9 TaxID=1073089 RepID=A0A1L9R4W0_ASPWE|nr:uncharacterized protein ASPWEDRAFT_188323 [Aspergillus wentii DTO 134E9]KAI9927195.1 hypothetical protein MW887_003579 [Aspergillus wentii]OJJ29923.1 hypothetical protein ASPWEDRAFT_188323 [Aspergillus wentii DTO 134E9]
MAMKLPDVKRDQSASEKYSRIGGSHLFNAETPNTRRFWLLMLCSSAAFLFWLMVFSWMAGLLSTSPPAPETSILSTPDDQGVPLCVDIFFALLASTALDSLAVVFSFNRSLIRQYHYFVSLRMAALAIIISIVVYLCPGSPPLKSGFIIFTGTSIYAVFIIITDGLHGFFPNRRISIRQGSMLGFTKHMRTGLGDISWNRSAILTAMNFFLYVSLTKVLPTAWSHLIPVIQLSCEPIFSLMGAQKTLRYNMLAGCLFQASACFEWGVRQVIASPKLIVAPSTFLALILVNRLLVDLHLSTIFRHRKDLHWARQEVLTPTRTLAMYTITMLLLQSAGMPIVTYIKPLVVAIVDVIAFLPHAMPACYSIAFEKGKAGK